MNLTFPAQVENGRTSDTTVTGEVRLSSGRLVPAVFDPDVEPAGPDDFQAPFGLVARLAERLSDAGEAALRVEIASEISDAAYEDQADVPQEQVDAFRDDLSLAEARFFPDAIVLIYRSPTVFAEREIVVQLTEELETDEIYVA